MILDKKRFTPTDVGRVVNKFLTEHFAHWVDYEFTAKMEDELDDISNGKEEWVPVLEKFWKDFSAQIGEKESVSRKDVTQEAMDEMCPKCGKHQLTHPPGPPRALHRLRRLSGVRLHAQRRRRRGRGSSPQKRELGADPKTHKLIQLSAGSVRPLRPAGRDGGRQEAQARLASRRTSRPDVGRRSKSALQLLALPRDLGPHPESGKKVHAAIGRFGPYVSHDGQFKSIPKDESVFDIGLERAVALLKEPKAVRRRAAP